MTHPRLTLRGGNLVDPALRSAQTADLHIADGCIVGIGAAPGGFAADRTVDAAGLTVSPGLIDLCAFLREPGQEHKATIASEMRAAAAGGITTVCMSPERATTIDSPAEVRLIQAKSNGAGYGRILPTGALSRDLRGVDLSEMSALKQAGCLAVSNGPVPTVSNLVLRRAMEYAASYDLLVVIKPEDPALRDNGCVHEGRVAMRLGLPGIPEAAETAAVAQALALAEHTGARVHFGQISCARTVEMLRHARGRGLDVTADVAAHQLFLSEDDVREFDARCHVIPPLRSAADCEALRQGLRDGVIDAICSDHQPHDADAKLDVFAVTEPGIAGLQTLLPLALRLAREHGADLAAALAPLTIGPARVLKLDEPRLTIGARADLCVIDTNRAWVVDASTWLSRGLNTPFWGETLLGWVRLTLVEGRPVWETPWDDPASRDFDRDYPAE